MPRFAIGTTNIPKSEAVEHVIMTCPYFAGQQIHFSHHKVSSGVPDMPTTLDELRTGAKNRAQACRNIESNADYFIGMEGGVYKDQIGEEYWIIGIVYIENSEGIGHYGYSAHLRVPEKIKEGLFDGTGRDLEQIVHALGGEKNVGDKEGSYGAWSDGMLTRKAQFIMATQCAIAPFFNRFYLL